MALRLRRGTDAERLLVTPLQGELVYATDTKKIYVGDGAVAGGVLIGPTDADAFTSVISDTTPQLGGGLDLNGNNITGTGSISITGSLHATGNITSDGSIGLGNEDSDIINVNGVINSSLRPALDGQYDLGTDARKWRKGLINSIESTEITATEMYADRISGNDSTVLWNSTTDTLTVGIANVTTLNVTGTITAATFNGNMSGNLLSDDSTALIDANTKTANLYSITAEAGALNGVSIGLDAGTPRQDIIANNIRSLTGFTGNLAGSLTGNVTGDVYGSIKGSVFGGDSSVIIDEATNRIYGNLTTSEINSNSDLIIAFDGELQFKGQKLLAQGQTIGASPDTAPQYRTQTSRGTFVAPTAVQPGDALSVFMATGYTGSAFETHAVISMSVSENTVGTEARPGRLEFSVLDDNGTYDTSFARLESNGLFTAPAIQSLGMTTTVKNSLLAKVSGGIGLQGTIVYDTTLAGLSYYHGTDGWNNILTGNKPVETTSFIKPGVYADNTARDAAITTPTAGMMVFNTTGTKFQGYTGSAWVDLN